MEVNTIHISSKLFKKEKKIMRYEEKFINDVKEHIENIIEKITGEKYSVISHKITKIMELFWMGFPC